MESLGYVGIVLLMFLENVFPPIPSEVIMPLAGFTAASGELHLLGVIVAGMIGSVLGALPLYALGRAVGEDRLAAWADRHGRWLTVSGADVRRADDWFDQHGHRAVLYGRLVPGLRSLLSIPAGISGMPPVKFLLYTSLGTLTWSALLACAGYFLGENYKAVEHVLGPVGYVVLAVVVVAIGVRVYRKRSARDGASGRGAGHDRARHDRTPGD